MKFKFGLLPRVLAAIAAGIFCGLFFPEWLTRVAATFNALFGQFLEFIIPLLILGLVAPGIADLGRNAGRLLLLTAALAYGFTLISGFGTYAAGRALFPLLLRGTAAGATAEAATFAPYFTIPMPPVMGVMSALLLAFVLGLGMAYARSERLKEVMVEFRSIIERTIAGVLIPLLPLYIFGIFLSMTQSGQVASILEVFVKLIVVIFVLTLLLLAFQFTTAGLVARRNPFAMLRTMLPAYLTALGTQSSAATIPVTLERTLRLGVRPELASFVIPLCATIHLSGSMMKNCRLCAGRLDARRAAAPDDDLRRLHPAACRDDGGGSGRAGRCHHGGRRPAGVDAGFRRDARRADDCHLHRHGQLRHGHQRHGRRCRGGYRRHHRATDETARCSPLTAGSVAVAPRRGAHGGRFRAPFPEK